MRQDRGFTNDPLTIHFLPLFPTLLVMKLDTLLTKRFPKYCQLFSSRQWRAAILGAMTLTIVLWSAVNISGLALGAKFTPAKPRLGDTLVIDIAASPSQSTATSKSTLPTIKVGEKTYPAFALGKNRFRAMIPTTPLQKPGDREITVTDKIGTTTLDISVADRKFPIQRINLSPGKAGLQATALELKQVAAFKATLSPDKLWNGKFSPPNKGRTSSPYGVRRYYNGKFATDYYHRGLDYAGGYGSAVVAPARGRVVLIGREQEGFRVHGNVVGMDHGQGVVSIFMHLSEIDVEEDQILEPGDQIGAIGSTGSSTGPHLHWGLYVNAISVDPVQWRSTEIE
jgi:murein DD-endopeptidase MepM/ murein hydrolase activator NlpD